MRRAPRYEVVIPTSGRPSLDVLLASLGAADGPLPEQVLIVDDRKHAEAGAPLTPAVPASLAGRVTVLRSGGRGPAAARNRGWRAGREPWVAFLDDDVLPPPGWRAELAADLRDLEPQVVASQGRLRVPLPRDVALTDWQRNVAGLQDARWATADVAVRRAALEAVGGFDERFPRAYREDSDLGMRLTERGLRLTMGSRHVLHPVPQADRWVSLRKQAGNADDALMRALHGRDWRSQAGAPAGRLRRHAAVTAAGVVAVGAALTGARRTAAAMAAAWLAGTAELAWARIAPGPRTGDEIRTMAMTSAVLPAAATAHRIVGALRARRLMRAGAGAPIPSPPLAVLLDRDGTLVHDVPYNKDPTLVLPLPGVRLGLDHLRAHGIRLAIVSNQSGVARGLLAEDDVAAVMAGTCEWLGPIDDVRWCPHGPEDGCACRKPAPGLLLEAAAALGVDPLRCALIGDIGADVEAAAAAGMRGILVPTAATRPQEIVAAGERAATFSDAVDRLLAGAADVPGPRVVRPARPDRATPPPRPVEAVA
ncbi:HAD-IIIA family hydrolase [Baekduia sp.]|uniref:HAD-IIIA family hydrolase n=1 Tax=Baekduia sp. TaxID=2600305 RepID=UPI002E0C2072|nr:HAD-IIIA family hydrolase [Baekduia sp.]